MQEPINIPLNQLYCENNHCAKLLCCKETCSNCALICRHQSCMCLPKEHSECQFVYMENIVSKITKKKKAINKQLETAFNAIEKVYDEAIEQLSKDKQKLNVWKANYGLSIDEATFINAVLANNRTQLVGSLVFKVKSGLLDQSGSPQWLTEQQVIKFWKGQQKKFNKLRTNLLSYYQTPSSAIGFEIDTNHSHIHQFRIDTETKTIQRLRSESWDSIVGKKQISQVGKSVYQIQILKSDSRYIMMGVATQAGKQINGPHTSVEGLMYYLCDGNIYQNGNSRPCGKSITVGSRVRMEVDMNAKQIIWYQNGNLIGQVALNNKFTSGGIYPVISFGGLDKISL